MTKQGVSPLHTLQVGDRVKTKKGARLKVVAVSAVIVEAVPLEYPEEKPSKYDATKLTFIMRGLDGKETRPNQASSDP